MQLNKVLASMRPFCFSLSSFILLSIASTSYADESASTNDVHIRTLAASCAACHGTNGNSLSITPVLAGLDPEYFSIQMQAFKHGSRESTVMHHHATGITDEEIQQLAAYFWQQKRIAPPLLKPQTLREKP